MNRKQSITGMIQIRLTGLLFALAFCAGMFALPAKAAQAITPVKVKVDYPIAGMKIKDTECAKPEEANYVDILWYEKKPDGSTKGISQTELETATFSAVCTYSARITITYSGNYNAPSHNGWGVTYYDFLSERTKAMTSVTPEVQHPDARYFVYLQGDYISPLTEVTDFQLEYSSDWNFVVGDEPDFDVKIPESKAYIYSIAGDILWYTPDNEEMVKGWPADYPGVYEAVVPVKLNTDLNPDLVIRTEPTLNVPDGCSFEALSDASDTITFYIRVPFRGTIDKLSITGIEEPKDGSKPKSDGFVLNTENTAGKYCECELTDPAKIKWTGNFNADGRFKERETYVLEIPYTISYDPRFVAYDAEKGFPAKTISAGNGVLKEDELIDRKDLPDAENPTRITESRVLKLSYTAPRTTAVVSFDANGGNGSMAPATVKVGSSYALPKCTFAAPSGKIFDRWDKGTVGQSLKVEEDIVLKALWKDAEVPATDSYKITKPADPAKKTGGTVEYTGPKDAGAAAVEIPDTMLIEGVTYKVESIASDAFKDNKTLTTLIIGKNVKSIGKNAFAGCTSLVKVDCRSKVLVKIGAGAFKGDKKLKTFILKTAKLKAKGVGKDAIKGTHKKLTIKAPKKVKKSYKAIFKKKGNPKVKVK